MSTVAKILVVVNLLLAAAFVGSAAAYLGYQETWHDRWVQQGEEHTATLAQRDEVIQQHTQTITEQRDSLNTVRDELATERASRRKIETEHEHLRTAYDQQTAQLTSASDALERMSTTLSGMRETIRQQQDVISRSERELQQVREERDVNVEALASAQQQLDNALETSRSLEAQVGELTERRERLENELAMVRRRGGAEGVPAGGQPAHRGRVLAAEPSANVYIISLGEEDGIREGHEYIVSRGSQYVGTLRVRAVESKQSAAMSLRDQQQAEIQAGDRIAPR